MFYTNKEDKNYLMISKEDLYLIIGMNIDKDLYNEVISIIRSMKQYSREHNYISVTEVALKKIIYFHCFY